MDRSRSEPLYNPASWRQNSVGLIGAGAVGSKVAIELACLGVEHVTVYDMDFIEPHNLSNQAYHELQVGMRKSSALEELIGHKVGHEQWLKWQFKSQEFTKMIPHSHKVLISALDTRSGRQEVMWSGMTNSSTLVMDCRMDAMQGAVHMYNPGDPKERKVYTENLPSEDYEGEKTACGLPINCGTTSGFVASTAVAMLINWWSFGIRENIHFNLRAMETWRTPVMEGTT
jgi:molybdopterin/thiamine biosynthesis adenylyltransferase